MPIMENRFEMYLHKAHKWGDSGSVRACLGDGDIGQR